VRDLACQQAAIFLDLAARDDLVIDLGDDFLDHQGAGRGVAGKARARYAKRAKGYR